jgi:hypothetical protein
LQWGENEQFLYDRWRETGECPDSLKKKPKVHPWLSPYWEAWLDLSASRPIGLGIGAIPISEMKAYCELLKVPWLDDLEEMHFFLRLIRAVDSVYLDKQNKKLTR